MYNLGYSSIGLASTSGLPEASTVERVFQQQWGTRDFILYALERKPKIKKTARHFILLVLIVIIHFHLRGDVASRLWGGAGQVRTGSCRVGKRGGLGLGVECCLGGFEHSRTYPQMSLETSQSAPREMNFQVLGPNQDSVNVWVVYHQTVYPLFVRLLTLDFDVWWRMFDVCYLLLDAWWLMLDPWTLARLSKREAALGRMSFVGDGLKLTPLCGLDFGSVWQVFKHQAGSIENQWQASSINGKGMRQSDNNFGKWYLWRHNRGGVPDTRKLGRVPFVWCHWSVPTFWWHLRVPTFLVPLVRPSILVPPMWNTCWYRLYVLFFWCHLCVPTFWCHLCALTWWCHLRVPTAPRRHRAQATPMLINFLDWK